MGQLSSVIKALGVEKVIWIDDMFAAVAEPEPVDEIALARSIADENLFDALGVADMGTEPEPVTSLVQAFYDDPDLLEKAKTLVVVRNPADHAKHVMTVMGCEAEARSGADWQGILKSQGLVFQKTLFLVDRDFRREGINADQSNALLKDTVANFLLNSTNYCIVLTKEVSVENENSERSKFLASLFAGTLNDKDLIRFSVISKNSLEAGGEQILSNSLRDKLAGVILYSMLERVEQSLEGSVAAMRGILVSEFPDINKAVLQNSYKEGVSELDVLLRILQQKHRIELAKIMKEKTDGGLQTLLRRFRLFQIDDDNGLEILSHTISGELSHLCRAEIITDGPLVNDMLLPVVPGDVFATIDPTQNVLKKDLVWAGELEIDKSYFMLLGQLCDVVPRGDTGESATNMAFLVKFSVKAAKGHDKNLPRNQLNSGRVGWMTVGDLALHFDFRSVLSANMLALRLCSYNRNGVAYLKESDSAEDMWSLASIARAKIKSIERFASGSKVPPELQYYATAFHSDDTARGLSISGRRGRRLFKYPVRRVCRIREVEASEALGALERYWRRPAKPNYFVN